MADATKKASETTPPAAAPRAPAAPAGLAAESGDPAVHQLLAERQTVSMNGGDTTAVDEQLVKLGFTEYRR